MCALLTPVAATAQDREVLGEDDTDIGVTDDRPVKGTERACLQRPFPEICSVVRVEAILVEGNARTKRYVIVRELDFEEGGYASLAQIRESIQRLRNLGLFREVTYELESQKVAGPEGMPPEFNPRRPSRVLKIRVDERWTLLPFFTLLQGGGLTRFATGASNVNFLGRYLEIGFQYDRLGFNDAFFETGGAANSFIFWFRDPRFLNTRVRAGFDIWRTVRFRSLFNDATGEREGGFTLSRNLLVLRTQQEFNRWFYAGINVELIDDSFSYDFLPEDRQQLQQENFGGLPESGRAFVLRGTMRFGRVDQDDFYYDGWSITQTVAHSDELWGADFRFTELEAIASFYKRLPFRQNIAARVRAGTTNTEQVQYLFYLGGLNRVRGYPDSRFRGQSYWSVNAEWRWAAIQHRLAAVQVVAFSDAGATSGALFPTEDIDALSTGGGFRLIVPKLYGFVARIDYAFALVNSTGTGGGLSFGAQQFF